MLAATRPARALLLAVAVGPVAAFQRVAKAEEMPDVSDVLKKPHRVFDQMNARIASLSTRLQESRAKDTEAVAAKAAAYQRMLQEQEEKLLVARRNNSELQEKTAPVQRHNTELRGRATELMQWIRALSADLDVMRSNLTDAQEFLDKEEGSVKLAVEASPAVAVLAERRGLEATIGEQTAKEERMNGILKLAPNSTSLLQVVADASKRRQKHGQKPLGASDLLLTLASSLGELSQQQNASEINLDRSFEKAFAEGDATYNLTMETQAQRKVKLDAEVETQEKLKEAVESLQGTFDQLKMRSEKLRAFLGRVATLELGDLAAKHISLLQEVDEE